MWGQALENYLDLECASNFEFRDGGKCLSSRSTSNFIKDIDAFGLIITVSDHRPLKLFKFMNGFKPWPLP